MFYLIFGGLIQWWSNGSQLGLVVRFSGGGMGLGYGITVILRFLYGVFNGYNKNITQGIYIFFLGMGFLVGTRDGLLISLLIS